MSDLLSAVRDLLATALPSRAGAGELSLPEPSASSVTLDGGHLEVNLRLVVFDDDGGLRDVKEQEVVLADASELRNPARVVAYLRASLSRISAHLAHLDDTEMPRDLFFPEALADSALVTEADFAGALSGPDARIGQFLDVRDQTEFLELVDDCGLDDHRDGLWNLRRPSVVIETERLVEPAPVGTSRLGGLPDLPSGLAWPCWADVPFEFIGQINLREVHASAPREAAGLPATGILYFFHFMASGRDAEQPPRGGGQVLYFDGDLTTLRCEVARPGGDGADVADVLAPRAVAFARDAAVLPPLDSPYYAALVGASDRSAELFSTFSGLGPSMLWRDPDAPAQQVLGYALPYQSSPNIDIEGELTGRPPEQWIDGPEFFRRAASWELLLQVDSEHGDVDDEPDVMYGDDGRIFFMIRPADLAARRFDAAWANMQCS